MTTSNPVVAAARTLSDLSIRPYSVGQRCCLVELTGEVDLASAPGLRAALAELCELGYTRFVLDLSGVAHMDSTGLGVLVGLQNRLKRGGGLSLAAVRPNLAQLLRVVGLNTRIPSFPTAEAALGETGASGPRSPVALERSHTAAQPSGPNPAKASADDPRVAIGSNAGLVLGLASTALPFAESQLAEAERWLRILRRYGDAGRILRKAGVREAPFANLAANDPSHPERMVSQRAEDRLATVTEEARRRAAGRSGDAVSTIDLLLAVVASYGSSFERALVAYGGELEALDAQLGAARPRVRP